MGVKSEGGFVGSLTLHQFLTQISLFRGLFAAAGFPSVIELKYFLNRRGAGQVFHDLMLSGICPKVIFHLVQLNKSLTSLEVLSYQID